jgi:hypothetical protein
MAGGGLMQLVAYGAQDVYLTGNPQITFFKVVYRRHTNFSSESIEQTINGTSTIGSAATSGTVTISRNGDLVGRVVVTCDQDTANGVNGDKIINEVSLEIGGQEIDKHTEEWMQVWSELSTPESKAAGYKYMTGGFTNALVSGGLDAAGGTSQQMIQVPLQFSFCRNPGLALPLIALQYHEVKLKFTWGTDTNVGRDGTAATPTLAVWADYFYLDTDERRRFAQVSHEYLIEQLQYQTEGTAATKYKLNFNHPVKELVWTTDPDAATNPVVAQKAKITLNGHDRFSQRDREYFQLRQPMDHHTAVPGFNIKETARPQNTTVTAVVPVAAGAAVAPATTPTGNGTFHVDAAGGTTSNEVILQRATDPGLKVGDTLVLSYEMALAGDSFTVVTTIKTMTTNWTATATDMVFEVTEAVLDSIAGGGSIYKIASTQNPASRCSQLDNEVNVYSFALKPEEHQPSGTCNFSRIDTAYLEFDDSATVEVIYAVNYNVLRIMSGMGGLAYSN